MSRINTELFIARRIFSAREGKKRFSRAIVSFAIIGIALGLILMILSVAIVTGFKSQIRRKVIGFGSDIQVVNFDSNSSYETKPVPKQQLWLDSLRGMPDVRHIQMFATKPGIIKTKNEIQGVVLKGVGPDFDWGFFRQNMVKGKIFHVNDSVRTDNVIISEQLADLLKLKLGDPLFMYFLNDVSSAPRMRRFKITGIYKTSLEEFDRLFILADIKHIQRLNNWTGDEVSGFEVSLKNFDQIDRMTQEVRNLTLRYEDQKNLPVLRTVSIKLKYPQIFDWLNLLDMNVWVILGLILIVAGFNMVSGLLILILERTNMIGVMKALGTENMSVRKVFLYLSTFLIGKGMLWGNIIGLLICFLQAQFGIIKLDPTSYYVNTVPINLKLLHFVLLNIGTLVITMSMLVIPSWYISRITPDKAIRFD
ncbi:ABC transporter permease [Prolixibacter sp. SD074]|uniref:ABC transporter permease n=1 Tax=Prolixibacter sp. SD074 TaxID=2652391 RepID=UPI00126E64E8|nr:ABC transporter permease [Prolixibacter sp. SD074]GET30036.1 ABC transporter permease [Prolixibacter sp. SD074]